MKGVVSNIPIRLCVWALTLASGRELNYRKRLRFITDTHLNDSLSYAPEDSPQICTALGQRGGTGTELFQKNTSCLPQNTHTLQ